MTTTLPAFHPKEIQTRFLYPFFFDRGQASAACDALSRKTITSRDGASVAVWECDPPPGLYKEELLDHVDRFLFQQSERSCRYLRMSNAVSSRWFNRLQVVLAEPKPTKQEGLNGIATHAPGEIPKRVVWPVRLAPLASCEIFLTNYGVGVFSIALIPEAPELDLQTATLFNYKLAQFRPQIAARLGIPHPSEDAKVLGQMPPLQKEQIGPAPAADAPASKRLGCAGGTFLLGELLNEVVVNPLQSLRIESLQKQFSVYTVVGFGDEVDFEAADATRALLPFLSSLAQIEEPRHAGAPTGIAGVTNAILNRNHSAAVGLLGMAHIVSDQPISNLAFNEQRVPRVMTKYFVPYLAGLLQRASLHRTMGEASDLVLDRNPDLAAGLAKLRSHLLEFAVEGYFPEVSHRDVIDRYYRMVQEGLGVRRSYQDVSRAIADIDAQFANDHQSNVAQAMADNVEATRSLQEQMNNHLHVMASVQVMVGWIEVFFVSMAIAQLAEIVVSHVDKLQYKIPHVVLGAAALGFLVSAVILKPWEHKIS